LDREFSFTLDVAATVENAKCSVFFTRKENGLAQPWQERLRAAGIQVTDSTQFM
jgi:site-specific DNA-methyltransferase (adenine-specific)